MASLADLTVEPRLLRDLQQGRPAAQAEIYRLLAPRLLGMAMRILQDRGLAQEVVQDTFVELIERGGRVREADAMLGWIRKVAVNHCLMRLRSPWNRRRVVVTGSATEAAADGMSQSPAGTGYETSPETYADIERALASLNPESRLVVWLHDVEGYTHKEIGRLLGRTASYSKSKLARSYEQLLQRTGGSRNDSAGTPVRPACLP